MKILLDLRSIRPKQTGVGVSALLTARALAGMKNPPEMTGIFLPGCVPDDLRNNMECIEVSTDYQDHPSGEIFLNFRLPEIARKHNADILYNPGFMVPWVKTPFKKVVTIQDLIAFQFPETYSMTFGLYIRYMTKFSSLSAHRIIAPSEYTKNDLADICRIDPGKIDLAPYYPDPVFQPVAEQDKVILRDEYELPEKFILCVGTLEKRKNQTGLIRAFEILKTRSDLPHRLILVGLPGHGSSEIRKVMNNSEFRKDIIHRERVNRKKLAVFYSCADLTVFPSFYEGFGLPALEAMASGCPLAVSRAASLPEITQDAAVYFQPDNPAGMASVIQKALNSPASLKNMSERGIQQSKQFNMHKTAEALISAFTRVLE